MKSGTIALSAACILILLLVLPAGATTTTVLNGGTVFIGEEGLDLSATLAAGDSQIAYYSSGATVGTSAPQAILSVSPGATFFVSPSDFLDRTGAWYSYPNGVNGSAWIAVFVEEPYLNVRLWVYPSNAAPQSAEGYKLITGDNLNFRIETNTYQIFSRPGVAPSDDGIDVYVTEPDGTTYTALFDSVSGATSIPIINLKPTSSVWYIPNPSSSKQYIWDTGNPAYKSGTYEYWAEISVNAMKENYAGTGGNVVQETMTSDILSSATEPLTPTATPTPDYIEATGTVALNVNTGGYVQVDTRLWEGSLEEEGAYVFLPKGTQALNEKAQALKELSLYMAPFLDTGIWPSVPEGQNVLVAYHLGPESGPGTATFSPPVELGILISDNSIFHTLYWLNERLDRWDEVDATTDSGDGYLKADITKSGIYLMTYPAPATTEPTAVPTGEPTPGPTEQPTTPTPMPTETPLGWLAPLGACAMGAALLLRKR